MKLFAFAVAALACAGAAVAQPPAGGMPSAGQIAQMLQQRLPMAIPDTQVQVVAVAAEGQTLVFGVDVPADQAGNADQIATALVGGFCRQGGAALMRGGISMRIDVGTAGGARTQGQVVTSCPAG